MCIKKETRVKEIHVCVFQLPYATFQPRRLISREIGNLPLAIINKRLMKDASRNSLNNNLRQINVAFPWELFVCYSVALPAHKQKKPT